MSKITSIRAHEILDSRGNPTVRVHLSLNNSIGVSASVPSGAATGEHEAVELRDGDKARYAETFHALSKILRKKDYATSVGDEGGYVPNLRSNEEACKLIVEAIEVAGYEAGKDIAIALDPAPLQLSRVLLPFRRRAGETSECPLSGACVSPPRTSWPRGSPQDSRSQLIA